MALNREHSHVLLWLSASCKSSSFRFTRTWCRRGRQCDSPVNVANVALGPGAFDLCQMLVFNFRLSSQLGSHGGVCDCYDNVCVVMGRETVSFITGTDTAPRASQAFCVDNVWRGFICNRWFYYHSEIWSWHLNFAKQGGYDGSGFWIHGLGLARHQRMMLKDTDETFGRNYFKALGEMKPNLR